MVLVGMSQYDCPNERDCMVDNNDNMNFAIKITYRRKLDLKWYEMK